MSKNKKSPTSTGHNSSGGEGDDSRKKRGNSQDEREASKKVRSEAKTILYENESLARSRSPKRERGRSEYEASSSSTPHTNERAVWDLESAILYLVQLGNAAGKKGINKKAIGLDTSTQEKLNNENEIKDSTGRNLAREYLNTEENSWITFRAAHAGDASTIAHWYRRQQSESRGGRRQKLNTKYSDKPDEEPEIEKTLVRASSSNEEETNSEQGQISNSSTTNTSNETTSTDEAVAEENVYSSFELEHWLAEGLGDENNCPFVHGLLAYVHRSTSDKTNKKETVDDTHKKCDDTKVKTKSPARSEDKSSGSKLAAVVLMSLSWAFGKRTLKIEWMSIDSSMGNVLRQKVWLRIHTLSSMTACTAISVDEELLRSDVSDPESGEQQKQEEEPLEGRATSRKLEPSAE